MSFGFDIIRCCIKAKAHFKAADVGESVCAFLSPCSRSWSIDGLTSIANRTASFACLYAYALVRSEQASRLNLGRYTVSSISSSSSSSSSPGGFQRPSSVMILG